MAEKTSFVNRSAQIVPTLPRQDRAQSRTSARRAWRWLWLAVVVWMVSIFILINFRFPRALSASTNIYLAQPLAWTSLAILAFIGWRFGVEDRPRPSRAVVFMAFLTGLFQMALFIIAGLFLGFGRSPYGHRLQVVLGNLVYLGTTLVGVEMSRAYLLAVSSKRSPTFRLLSAALFFSLISIPAARFTSIGNATTLFRVTGETFLPTVAENLLASFLALIGGPVVSMVYRGTLQLFEWLSPILPDLEWIVTAFVGTIAPALGMLVIWNQVQLEATQETDLHRQDGGSLKMWVFVGLTAVTLLWFNTGLFGVRPTLVSGVSMEPALLAGDVVITRDVPADRVQVGDIVRFQLGSSYVLHRVMEIQKDGSQIQFITRGDANNVDDAPLPESELKGKVILVVPKIGWVGIGVRRIIEWIR
ncbi:MAG: signal peptidase I [Anaerolineales bacterium]|nr:signal peptidase I [Anaerolineales bacterium]